MTKKITKRMKKVFCIIGSFLGVVAVIVVLNFIPTWNLKTNGMKKLEGSWIDVYYETEEAAAKDVFAYADGATAEIAEKLGVQEKQNVSIYIYDDQRTMQTKKYGWIAYLLGLDWYIGDNIGTDVLLTSPANPGKVHTYDDNKYAVLHEIVHAYISVINPDIALWLTEGMALYLSNKEPFYREYVETMGIPTYRQIKTENPVKFADIGGYTFASTYIEYLTTQYSWNKVQMLIETEDYETVFGKEQKDLYEEWVDFLQQYYQ